MRFTPKTEEEIAREALLPEGTYSFTVAKSEDKVSKAGNDMIKIQLTVFGDEREGCVFDYLMEAMPGKLIEFCQNTGLYEKYLEGTLDASDCENREGWAVVKIAPAKGDFGPSNTVKSYCKKPDKEATEKAERLNNPGTGIKKDDGSDEDEIPF